MHNKSRNITELASEDGTPEKDNQRLVKFTESCKALDLAVIKGATKALRVTHADTDALNPSEVYSFIDKVKPLRKLFEEASTGLPHQVASDAAAALLAGEDPATAILGRDSGDMKDLDGDRITEVG